MSSSPNHESSGGGHRILVVDDDRDSARSISMLLKLWSHDVQVAQDGLEAIALAEQFLPRFILLDIRLPGLNGYDTCRRIRSEPWGKNSYIIAVTGLAEDRRTEQDAGFDAYLRKPIDLEALEKMLITV